MTRRQKYWTGAFLGGTALVLAMEVAAAFDSSGDTLPWTALITHYVPRWVFWPAFTLLVAWIVWHFTHQRWGRQAQRARYKALVMWAAELNRPMVYPDLKPHEIHRAQVNAAFLMLGIDPNGMDTMSMVISADQQSVMLKMSDGSVHHYNIKDDEQKEMKRG